jgi:hypothetical protein
MEKSFFAEAKLFNQDRKYENEGTEYIEIQS